MVWQKFVDNLSRGLAFFPPNVGCGGLLKLPARQPLTTLHPAGSRPAPAAACGSLHRLAAPTLSAPLVLLQPPTYQLAQHGDGDRETYVHPLRRCGLAASLLLAYQPARGDAPAVGSQTSS